MKLDLRPRCKYCNKIPRSKFEKEAYEKRYPGFCSYDHQERQNLRNVMNYLATLPRPTP